MANPDTDFLDGSDVDEDAVGDVDQDQENVLLGSDDEEASHRPHSSKSFITRRKVSIGGREGTSRKSEPDDVLLLAGGAEEELLDYDEGDPDNDGEAEGSDQYQELGAPGAYDENIVSNENFQDRRYAEEDDYEDGDDEEESRKTRARFTNERKVNVDVYNNMAGGSSSVGIPIQTVGERKVRPQTPEGRPRNWNHNGPRHPGPPRHPGRNQRFQHPRPGPNEMHIRGMAPPIVQFNDGLFTDFNQPMRHHNPRHRPPHGRFESPRHLEAGPLRHPGMLPPDHMRPGFLPHRPQNRPFYPPPNENRFGQPMPPPPGVMGHPPGGPPRHDFNPRGPRPPPRFPNHNQRNQRPPHPHNMNGPHPQHERPPHLPRQQPPFRAELPLPQQQRPPPQQGYPAPHGGPPGFIPPPNANNHPRFMNHPRPPLEVPNLYYNQEQPPQMPPYHAPEQAPAPYPQHDAQWGQPDPNSHYPHQGQWGSQQQNYGAPAYSSGMAYDQQLRPPNSAMLATAPHIMHQMSHQPMIMQPHQLEISPPITKSIYIKPNSEIHEALSKGQFRLKDDDRRFHEQISSSSSSSKYYDDDYYRDRERSSRRDRSPERDRRRDDYYDDDRYHDRSHRDRDRRRYDDERDRRRRSTSPDKKISRPDRSIDERRRDKEKEVENKEAEKLLEEAKKMGLGEDYVKKLEEQRKLRERILKTKEQRRKLVKVPSTADASAEGPSGSQANDPPKASSSNSGAGSADPTKNGKQKKILRIVRDKSGKIISKKVHVVLVAKHQQDGQQSTSAS